jgi:sulfur carrier protein ThiS
MKIRILKLGQAAHVVDVEPNTNIGEALHTANLGSEGYTIALNGLGAGHETSVSDGDVVTLVPKVVGGVAA